ncbi:F-box domain-containing protein [Mycena kentingensis (nom. inval.)]|nr:F-box domain-containing protein [Mycena kentingensis (nom. inval.)]
MVQELTVSRPACSPVALLPPELVAEIFLLCIPLYPNCPPLFGIHSPLKLTQICKLWREIAHTTPRLWTSIALLNPDFDRYPLDRQLTTARSWLNRTRRLPLSVVFDNAWDLSAEERQRALAVLLEHRAKWEHAVLRVEDTATLETIAIADAPLLQELEVHAKPDADAQIRWPFLPPHSAATAPKLRSLLLHNVDVPFEPTVGWDWSRLTRVHLPNTSVAVIASLLRQAPNIVDCHVVVARDDLPESGRLDVNLEPLVLPHLETFIIRLHDDLDVVPMGCCSGLGKLFRAIRAPALKRLYVEQDLVHYHDEAPRAPPQEPSRYDPRNEPLPKVVASMGCEKSLQCLYVAYTSVPLDVYLSAPALKNVRHISATQSPGVALLTAKGGSLAGHDDYGWPKFALGYENASQEEGGRGWRGGVDGSTVGKYEPVAENL